MLEDYEKIAKLGDGAQGKVFHVRRKKTGREYALKVIRCRDQAQANLALKEIKVLIQLRHPGIVSYTDFFLDFDSRRPNEILVCLVMELCLGNDLEGAVKDELNNFMRTGKNGTSEATALSWILQAAEALDYLHGKGFLHRDVKPTNIFFAAPDAAPPPTGVRSGSPLAVPPSRIKLGDFGLATSMGVDLLHSVVGTPLYIAPELLLKKKYDFKVDVWGLGVVLLEVLTLQERPINSEVIEDEGKVESVVKDIRKMGYSSSLANLVRDMLHRNPTKRPTPREICERASILLAGPTNSLGRRSSSAGECGSSTTNTTPCSSRPSSAGSHQEHEPTMHHGGRPSAVTVEVIKRPPTVWDGVNTPTTFGASPSSGSFPEEPPIPSLALPAGVTTLTCQMCEEEPSVVVCPDCEGEHYCHACDILRHKSAKRASHRRLALAVAPRTDPTAKSAEDIRSTLTGLLQPVVVGVPSQAADITTALRFVKALRKERNAQIADCQRHLSELTSAGGGDTDMSVANLSIVPHTLDKIVVERNLCQSGPVYVDIPVEITSVEEQGRKFPKGSASSVLDSDGDADTLSAKTIEVNAQEGFVLSCQESSRHDTFQQTGFLHNINIIQSKESGAVSTASGSTTGKRCAAVDVRGGTWLLEKCRITSKDGQGVIIEGPDTHATISECAILQTKGAGIYVAGCSLGGSLIRNRIVGCGSGIMIRDKRTDRQFSVEGNHILQSVETGIFCHESSPSVIENKIAESGACGIVIKGKDSNPLVITNNISHSRHAGIFVCDGASGEVKANVIARSGKSGMMLKAASTPLVVSNTIESGAETGVYISERSGGRYQDNSVLNNGNAGILVTTGAEPYVTSNTISGNRYEGIWVSSMGGGKFTNNDLRKNRKGAKDVEPGCSVVFTDNVEK